MEADWIAAERIVARMTGGRRTPGSGNQGIRGDITIRGSDVLIEVKQTSLDYLTLQYEWLEELEFFSTKREVLLVIFFELRGYVYYYAGKPSENIKPWSTKRLYEDKLPEVILCLSSMWALTSLEFLRELKR